MALVLQVGRMFHKLHFSTPAAVAKREHHTYTQVIQLTKMKMKMTET